MTTSTIEMRRASILRIADAASMKDQFLKDFGTQKIKNPDTGKDVQYSTALSNKEHPAHDKATQAYDQWAAKQKASPEGGDDAGAKEAAAFVETSAQVTKEIAEQKPEMLAHFSSMMSQGKHKEAFKQLKKIVMDNYGNDIDDVIKKKREIKEQAAEAANKLKGPVGRALGKVIGALGKGFHKAGTALGKMKVWQAATTLAAVGGLGKYAASVGINAAGAAQQKMYLDRIEQGAHRDRGNLIDQLNTSRQEWTLEGFAKANKIRNEIKQVDDEKERAAGNVWHRTNEYKEDLTDVVSGIGGALAVGAAVLYGVHRVKRHNIASNITSQILASLGEQKPSSGGGKKTAKGKKTAPDVDFMSGTLTEACSFVSPYELDMLKKHMDKEGNVDEEALTKDMEKHYDVLVGALPEVKKNLAAIGKKIKAAEKSKKKASMYIIAKAEDIDKEKVEKATKKLDSAKSKAITDMAKEIKSKGWIEKVWESGKWGKAGLLTSGLMLGNIATNVATGILGLAGGPLAALVGLLAVPTVAAIGLIKGHAKQKRDNKSASFRFAKEPFKFEPKELKLLEDLKDPTPESVAKVMYDIMQDRMHAIQDAVKKEEAKTAALHIAATSPNLRSALIKLAYSQPEMRDTILPLLKN